MKFNIFFDESHQLDKHNSKYCYYGILGYQQEQISRLNKLFKDREIKYELHFSSFSLNKFDDYYEILKFVLNNSKSNIYMVDCEQALSLGSKINLNADNLRKLFYIKLPERLIYGMTRKMPGVKDINITIDKSDAYGNDNMELLDEQCLEDIKKIIEKQNDKDKITSEIKNVVENKYKHIQLVRSLKDQLNAHSLYRNLNYKVTKIRQEDSKSNVALQSIDVLLGLIAFIFEEKYLDIPEEFNKEKLEVKLQSCSLTPDEEQLLFKSYTFKKGMYRLNSKSVNDDNINLLRELNKKLNIVSSKGIEKAEFAYRVLSDNNVLDRLYHSKMFIWSLENNDISKNIDKIYISKYISKFLNYKIAYDNENIKKLVKKHIEVSIEKKEMSKGDYAEVIGLNIANTETLIDRYLDILGIDI
ncbi:MAG: DUF3800 domain-containing protein [Clostridium sp.]